MLFHITLKYFRYHALRHLGASILDRASVNIGSIQRLLGHEHRTTTEIYLHSVNESEREAIKVFDELAKNPTVAPNKKTGGHQSTDNHLFSNHFMARLAGVEPATYGFVVRTFEFSNLLNLLKLLEKLFFILADFPYVPHFSQFWRKSPTESPTQRLLIIVCF